MRGLSARPRQVLQVFTPDLIEVWEGALTFCFFPLLVLLAYLLDIRFFSRVGSKKRKQETLAGAHLDVTEDGLSLIHI